MLKYIAKYTYIDSNGVKLFTTVLLPENDGKFPTLLIRTPYVEFFEKSEEDDVVCKTYKSKRIVQ